MSNTTPPPELVEHWQKEADFWLCSPREANHHIADRAAQWGADQELEACFKWLEENCGRFCLRREIPVGLREARRSKPPSLKQQALEALHAVATGANDTREQYQDFDTIRRALEALPDE